MPKIIIGLERDDVSETQGLRAQAAYKEIAPCVFHALADRPVLDGGCKLRISWSIVPAQGDAEPVGEIELLID